MMLCGVNGLYSLLDGSLAETLVGWFGFAAGGVGLGVCAAFFALLVGGGGDAIVIAVSVGLSVRVGLRKWASAKRNESD